MTLMVMKKQVAEKGKDSRTNMTNDIHQVHLPRAMKLNKEFLLPQASQSLWDSTPIEGEPLSYSPAF